MADLNLMGLPFPEEYGGGGADTISLPLRWRSCPGFALPQGSPTRLISLWAVPLLYLFGTEEQKQKYLVPLCQGKSLGAFGLTEPNAGSDAGGTRTTAVQDGDDWVINGSKCFITNASLCQIFGSDGGNGKERGWIRREITALIVPTDAEGFQVIDNYVKMGLHSSNTTELMYGRCAGPQRKYLGEDRGRV